MRVPFLTVQLLLGRWQYDILAEGEEDLCFGVNRLERPGEKNIIGRCKERYFAELLGAVNKVGKAALPRQDSGCRAVPGSCFAHQRRAAADTRGAPAARGGGALLAAATAVLQRGKSRASAEGASPQKRIWSGSLPAGIFSGFPLP